MQMKETVRSLRLYFILSGLAGALISGSALRVHWQHKAVIEAALQAISIASGVAFIYVGFRLSNLLKTSPGRIIDVLYASGGWTAIVFLIRLLRTGIPFGLFTLLLVLLIIWYLLKNVERLAAEAHFASPGASSSV